MCIKKVTLLYVDVTIDIFYVNRFELFFDAIKCIKRIERKVANLFYT